MLPAKCKWLHFSWATLVNSTSNSTRTSVTVQAPASPTTKPWAPLTAATHFVH